jgi:hypothetical protein
VIIGQIWVPLQWQVFERSCLVSPCLMAQAKVCTELAHDAAACQVDWRMGQVDSLDTSAHFAKGWRSSRAGASRRLSPVCHNSSRFGLRAGSDGFRQPH